MAKQRRRHSPEFKAKVALDAIKGQKTVNEIASEHGIHPNQVSTWKQELLQGLESLFRQPNSKEQRAHEALQSELYEQIGRLNMELEWLKKKAARFTDRETHPD